MPWVPELFSASVLERILDKRRHERLAAVPFFDGLMMGEVDALIGSFAGEPELHHPVRGRIKGAAAFGRFVTDTKTWLAERTVAVEDVNFIVTPRRGVEEVVLHLDGGDGRVELPLALVADRNEDARIVELRIYFSTWPLTGGHAIRPPLLQPDPDLDEPDIVGDYQHALAAGDVEAAVSALRSRRRSTPPMKRWRTPCTVAISAAARTPRALSIAQMNGVPGARSATHRTSSADSSARPGGESRPGYRESAGSR